MRKRIEGVLTGLLVASMLLITIPIVVSIALFKELKKHTEYKLGMWWKKTVPFQSF